MKRKPLFLFISVFVLVSTIHAQDYQLSFAGTGASTTVDLVKVENLTQCTSITISGSDILHLVASTKINELKTDVDNTMCIYPNPMKDYCLIGFKATTKGKTTIGLYDIAGKKILQVQELLTKGHHTYQLSGISNGIYTLRIESDDYSYISKIVSINLTPGNTKIKQIETIPNTTQKNTISTDGTTKKLKNEKLLIDIQYTAGDLLKLTGKSGIFRTVVMLVPTNSQTVTFTFVACTDADDNNYSVVQIGSQVWMAENLNVGTYVESINTGSSHSDVSDNGLIEKYCYDNLANCSPYGGLYDWDEMMQYAPSDAGMIGTTQGVCPTGWHIPTHHEWTTLEREICTSGTCVSDFPYDFTTLGYQGTDEGGKLKETCSSHWISQNTGATNESGFTALPGGCRDFDGYFDYVGIYGYFWTATEYDSPFVWYRCLSYLRSEVNRDGYYKTRGFSVRCLKD